MRAGKQDRKNANRHHRIGLCPLLGKSVWVMAIIAPARRLTHRIRGAYGAGALVEALLYGVPARTALGHGGALSNSARLPARAGMGHRVWDALLTRRGA